MLLQTEPCAQVMLEEALVAARAETAAALAERDAAREETAVARAETERALEEERISFAAAENLEALCDRFQEAALTDQRRAAEHARSAAVSMERRRQADAQRDAALAAFQVTRCAHLVDCHSL